MQIMPFEDAKTYRFNPFDLTKVWPHSDYPLIKVGKMTLNRNLTDFHTEMEQAAFEPNNLVPGIGLSPDKMLLARGFSYADAHRARLGVNYKQIPVNTPHVPVHSYSKDGAMRTVNVTDPVYAPNSYGGPEADPSATDEAGLWVGRRRDGRARPTRRGPMTMTSSRHARRCARCSTTTPVSGWSRTSPATWPTGSPTRCSRGRSSTGRTSTKTSARIEGAVGSNTASSRRGAGPGQTQRG